MTPPWPPVDLRTLLPGLETLLLALFGGAGGAALLEVWWNPWRTRRRVAALVAEEVNLNAQLLDRHADWLRQDPGRIAPDFRLSHLAFDAVAHEVAELPATVAGEVLLVYMQFDHANRVSELVREAKAAWDAAEDGAQAAKRAQQCHEALAAFQVALDRTFKQAEVAFHLLERHAPRRQRQNLARRRQSPPTPPRSAAETG